jgi:tetratricopeptide (TPR) repeat protein
MNDARRDEDLFRFASLDAGDGPAKPLSNDAADALVLGVLDAALPPAPASGSGGATASGASQGKVIAGLATLALVTAGVVWSLRTPEPLRTPVPPTVAAPPTVAVTPVEAMPEVVTPSVEATPVAPEVEVAHVRSDASMANATAEVNVVDLLAEANRLRRSGAYDEAEATYLRVVQTNPRAREAHVARVAAAGIRLERLDDAAGAARLYRDASRGSGALAAEATFGLARSTRELGDTAAETQALRALVERYPSSPYVRLAVERLRTLGITVTPEAQ